MNELIDIFKEVGEAKWFYFKIVGDHIQGTYLGRSEGLDQFKNEQYIYHLRDSSTKEDWNVGIRKTSHVVNDEMAKVQPGQIVGFEFKENRDSKISPTGKTKIIRVVHRPDLVDAEWIESQKKMEKTLPPVQPAQSHLNNIEDVPFKSAPAVPQAAPVAETIAVSDTHQAVRNLAITKGLNEENMSAATQDSRIMEYTGLALTDSNFAPVIMKLTEYKK
jgi:hypothetical protein